MYHSIFYERYIVFFVYSHPMPAKEIETEVCIMGYLLQKKYILLFIAREIKRK